MLIHILLAMPAEVALTFAAAHMRAASVFLDVHPALGTLLCEELLANKSENAWDIESVEYTWLLLFSILPLIFTRRASKFTA